MSSGRLAIGVIGCGWISEIAHLPNLLANPRAEIVAIADLSDERRARAMRRVPGAQAYREARVLLANQSVDAVIIATPPSVSAAIAADAFAAGKHVYIEKPGAVSRDEAEALRSAWRASGLVGMIGYNFRRNEAVEGALAAVRSGQLGTLIGIQSVFTWAAGEDGGWRSQPGLGGALLDLGSHHIDLVGLFDGTETTQASAIVRSVARDDDTADISLRFASGVTAMIHVSSAEGRNANVLRLFGSEGHMEVDLVHQGGVRVLRGDPPRGRLARAANMFSSLNPTGLAASGSERSFPRLLDDFLHACRNGGTGEVQPSIEAAVKVLRVLDMARTTTYPETR